MRKAPFSQSDWQFGGLCINQEALSSASFQHHLNIHYTPWGLNYLMLRNTQSPYLCIRALKACAFRMLILTSSRILLGKEISRERLDQGSHISITLYLNIWRLHITSAKISHCHLGTSNMNVPKTGLTHDSREGP